MPQQKAPSKGKIVFNYKAQYDQFSEWLSWGWPHNYVIKEDEKMTITFIEESPSGQVKKQGTLMGGRWA